MNNLNDALAWGLAPLYLAANGASLHEIAIVAAPTPSSGAQDSCSRGGFRPHRAQATDRRRHARPGRRARSARRRRRRFAPSLAAAVLLGAGTAMVYPTLIAAVSDASQPRDRARVVGVYRFWRDFGFVLGALIAGIGADVTSAQTAIAIVAILTGASGLFVAATSWQPRGSLQPAPSPSLNTIWQRRRQ